MLHCTEKAVNPCFHYETEALQPYLNTFLVENGGSAPEYLRNGTAIFSTLVKGEERLLYLFPGSWVRVITPGQFSVLTNKIFQERFEIVSMRPPMSEELRQMNLKAAMRSGMSEEAARQLVERMDADRNRIR